MVDEADPQTILPVSRERYARPSSEVGKKLLLLGIIHGDKTYLIKRVSSDSPTLPTIQGSE
jgi:hypothetical protein